MTRLYGFNLLCDACGRSGPFGWVYCCTQDREDLIEHCVAHGFSVGPIPYFPANIMTLTLTVPLGFV